MIKGKDILGRHIVAIDSGQRLDSVHDLIFDHQANEVLGLLVDEGGWFRAAKVVPFEMVRSIGEDAIMIDSADHVTTTRDDSRLADVLDSKVSLIGMTLLTTDGQDLGKIADVYFDEKTGKVEGYEATGGLFSDLSNGRTFVPAPDEVQIGADTAIVPLSVASAMQEQEPGGLKGAFSSAGDSIKGAYENIADATKERQKEYAIGKTAGGDITLDDGTVIVAKGDTITSEQAELAEQHGKLGALATTATGGAISDAYGNIADASRERQKEYVIGKAAGSDLQADDGSTIVTKGQIITAEQAERAERDGKLTALATNATGGVIVATYGDARGRVQGSLDDMRDATADRQKAYVVGKTASSDVMTDAGETIVYRDGVITQYQAERAEQTGKLGALTAAAISGSVQSAGASSNVDPSSPQAAIGRRAKTEVRSPSGSLVRGARPDRHGGHRGTRAASGRRGSVAGGHRCPSRTGRRHGLPRRPGRWIGERVERRQQSAGPRQGLARRAPRGRRNCPGRAPEGCPGATHQGRSGAPGQPRDPGPRRQHHPQPG